MKKDRNTFFQESSYMNMMGVPNQNIINPPFATQSYANQGFYAGPMNAQMNYNTGMEQNQNNYMNDYSEIESRLSKLERQINRLDMRLNKLEQNSFYATDEMDNTTNVYMV